MTVVTKEPTEEQTEGERVSDAPWNGSASGYTDEQYQSACALDRKKCGGDWADKPPKERCSLPYKTPSGEVSRAGVHAAASRISSVTDACPAAISSAKSTLRSAYKAIGESPPSSLGGSDKKKSGDDDDDSLLGAEALDQRFGVEPGVPRHGTEGLRLMDAAQVRDSNGDGDNGIGLLNGHFAIFNRWTEIDSFFEGRFLEKIAPGAFKKTFDENIKGMRCLFQHGRDPQIGSKPLGPIREVREDGKNGAYYEVPLDDTSYNRDLLPGLKSGLYGASFRFQVIREEVNTKPGRSEHNPEGIEERTIVEAKVREFGPVTFPAYEDATAGVRSRSLVDEAIEDEVGAAGFAALTRSRRYYHNLHHAEVERSTEGGTETPEAAPAAPAESESESERQEAEGSEAAPSEDAPEAPPSPAKRSTHLTSAARKSLRTSRNLEEPKWKL